MEKPPRRDVIHKKVADAIKEDNQALLMIIDPQVVEHVREYERYLID